MIVIIIINTAVAVLFVVNAGHCMRVGNRQDGLIQMEHDITSI